MKKTRAYKEGDKVFAKVKGYPAWPAVVLAKNGKKFSVQFYGTGETGYIKPEDLSYFIKSKEQFTKGSKKKEFKEALEQIEKAVAADGTDGDDSQSEEGGPSAKRKRSNSERSNDSAQSKKDTSKNSESDQESTLSESIVEPPSKLPRVEENIEAEVKSEIVETAQPKLEEVEPEDLPFVPNAKLITEHSLKNWIVYADTVKDNPERYKSIPADPRSYFINQVFPVLLPSGTYTGLKLHKEWPISFTNEYDCALYDNEVASRLLILKETVLAGETTQENEPESFLLDFSLNEPEIKKDAEMKLINNKYKRVERLRSESSLVELDAKIKNSLGLSKAEPKKALGFLDAMLEINMDEIMLKKHSHVVEMIRRLRKYIGNIEEWNLSQEELEVFLADAKNLRAKAEELYKKFKAVVVLPVGETNFWNGFNEIVRIFRENCKHLNNREVFVLTAEPFSRQAIIDRLEQEEELQEADINRPSEADIDKVGES